MATFSKSTDLHGKRQGGVWAGNRVGRLHGECGAAARMQHRLQAGMPSTAKTAESALEQRDGGGGGQRGGQLLQRGAVVPRLLLHVGMQAGELQQAVAWGVRVPGK